MRGSILISLFLIPFAAFSQPKDTMFLRRVIADTPYPFYNAVYIDQRPSPKVLKTICDFEITNSDSSIYSNELADLRPFPKNITRINQSFPKKWVSLFKLKGQYYLYCPSDFGNHYKFQITDTTTIDFTMEGPEPSKILSIDQLSNARIQINRSNAWHGEKVEINIVDNNRGIAVFTFGSSQLIAEPKKVLMVDADKAYLISAIINYCKTDKVEEYKFEKIDFSKLEK